ncbi:hypothetical protein EU537_09355 [Candidatus Thorarchaeota archaeon]|nr:MAG: hypothetical protein EU537_09355 [Candidatus Thorarchaeota archaeon]
MSSSWFFKTRQMSEAGKEFLLTQALATHMRSPRDRELVRESMAEEKPLEDIFSFFGAFYLYHYQGVRLLDITDQGEMTIEEQQALSVKEREMLELEIRQLLGNKQREELDVSKLVSEFFVSAIDDFSDSLQEHSKVVEPLINLLEKFLQKIPGEYSLNAVIDFLLEVTGWGEKWREEIYMKASGLKESSLSLRDELLRNHEEEVIESTLVKRAQDMLSINLQSIDENNWKDMLATQTKHTVAEAIIENRLNTRISLNGFRSGHKIRISLLEAFEAEIEMPTNLDSFEAQMAELASNLLVDSFAENPDEIFDALSVLTEMRTDEISEELASGGIRTGHNLMEGLSIKAPDEEEDSELNLSREELEEISRSLRRLEKIEETLEKPVKGMLRARGLRSSEIDKVSVETLTKNPSELIAIESQVIAELKKKLRLPTPEEISQLLELRAEYEDKNLDQIGSTAARMGQKLQYGETVEKLKYDLVWHSVISVLKNLARVIEIYIRSKHDLVRIKAILKSIYEESELELQFLREEILMDLASDRLLETKRVHPDLDASIIRSWYHARLQGIDLNTAISEVEKSPSPVFKDIIEKPLKTADLKIDNYAIAFDLMQRFLTKQRQEKVEREALMIEAKKREERLLESKKDDLDVMNYVSTKAYTAFRAIGRVGKRGLEWNSNDDTKLANLLSFYIRRNRGRTICSSCGEEVSEEYCPQHGSANIRNSNDIDNLSNFVRQAVSDIKEGLIGPKSESMTWDEARSLVKREISKLKQRGKITGKTDVNNLLPGEINYIVGPAIAEIIGQYFNDSLKYAARSADIA